MTHGTVQVLTTSKAGSNSRPLTELYVTSGETEVFKSSRTHGCCLNRAEDTMLVSSQRVLFLWRQWLCGINVTSFEEAFNLDDLQFMTIGYAINWLWFFLGLACLIVGAALLAVADTINPNKLAQRGAGDVSSLYAYASQFGRKLMMSSSSQFPIFLAVGIVMLFAGLGLLVLFVVKTIRRGGMLTLNFSRHHAAILDWSAGSWWRPKMSSTRRSIRLNRKAAQEAYNVLAGLLQHRMTIKAH